MGAREVELVDKRADGDVVVIEVKLARASPGTPAAEAGTR